MKTKKLLSLVLSLCLVAGIVGTQLITGTAEPECTCEIVVHGSNCPLSQCTCSAVEAYKRAYDGDVHVHHEEGCPLYGLAEDLTQCTCEADIHAPGCPRYVETDFAIMSEDSADGFVDASELDFSLDGETEESDTEDPQEPVDENADVAQEPIEVPSPEAVSVNEPEEVITDGAEDIAPAENENPASVDTEGEDTLDPADDSSAEETPDETSDPAEVPSDTEIVDPEAEQLPADGETGEEENPEDVEEPEALEEDDELEPMEEVPVPAVVDESQWEYPTGWDGYGNGWMDGNVMAAEASFRMDTLLSERIREVQGMLDRSSGIQLSSTEENFADVLAVYAVLSGQTGNYPYDVLIDDVEFASVYWSMTQVTGVSNSKGDLVHVRHLSANEAADLYEMSEDQRAVLSELSAYDSIVKEAVEKSIFTKLSSEEFAFVRNTVPEGISLKRKAIVMTALALEGKVDYFWGGKSVTYGWDDRWGESRTVSSEGSSSYGTVRPFGLDCSGFVSWVYANAFKTDREVETCSTGPWMNAYAIEWKDAKPGDIVYYYEAGSSNNHVGIVVNVDEYGPTSVMQCGNSGTRLVAPGRFSYAYRPYILDNE